MKHLNKIAIIFLLASVASAVWAAEKAEKEPVAEPAYDMATVVTVKATIIETRFVPEFQPLAGLHLMLRSGSETVDVYVGPSDFVKGFDVEFHKGDQIEVSGSKVTYNGAVVVLAREVRRGSFTLPVRDGLGRPFWNYSVTPPVDPFIC